MRGMTKLEEGTLSAVVGLSSALEKPVLEGRLVFTEALSGMISKRT